MKDKLIALAHSICKTNFMDYPDYDEDIELTLSDALTILVMENVPNDVDIDSAEVYDLISNNVEVPVK
jgi:hypothetical protein